VSGGSTWVIIGVLAALAEATGMMLSRTEESTGAKQAAEAEPVGAKKAAVAEVQAFIKL